MNVAEAEIALREARIAEEKERNKADREKYGECPERYNHFDGSIFSVGVCVGGAAGVWLMFFLHSIGYLP